MGASPGRPSRKSNQPGIAALVVSQRSRPLIGSSMGISLPGSGVPALLVVRPRRRKRVHLRLRVEDPGVECSEGCEKIHGGVDQHVYAYQGLLTRPKRTQRFNTLVEAFCL